MVDLARRDESSAWWRRPAVAQVGAWGMWRTTGGLVISNDPNRTRPRTLLDTSAMRCGKRMEVAGADQVGMVALPVTDDAGHAAHLVVPRSFAEEVARVTGYTGLVVTGSYGRT